MTPVELQLKQPGPRSARPRALRGRIRDLASPRAVLLCSLAIAWFNFLLTTRWALVPGTLNGWRRPYFAAALALATLFVLLFRLAPRPVGRLLPRLAVAGGAAVLAVAFFSWFPPGNWARVPILDNWPPRFQSTLEGIALLRRGAFGGWQWAFLGGYHTVSDITQNLAVLGFLPVALFGPTVGFHLLHALLFASIPLLVYLDLEDEDRDVALAAAGISCLMAGNFSYMFMRSGDTNSVAGVACTALALVGSHAARRGRRWGPAALALGLTLTAYSHAGFVAYAIVYLALEALYYRDVRSALRAIAALAVAFVASLPLTWELWRFGSYFNWNNLSPGPPPPFDWAAFAWKVYYNVEILFRPGRWTNDYTGLTAVFLPVIAFVACQRRSRSAFHAVGVLATVLLLRLNSPQFGYLFWRPMHMFTVFTAAPLAYFLVRRVGNRVVVASVMLVLGLYVQITFQHVPHVNTIAEFDPALVEHVGRLDGALVLLENNPHLNMNAVPGGETEPSAFNSHFESLLAAATGKRFYAGYWDGWQWSPWRTQNVAGGMFRGKPIAATSQEAFAAEMRRWGVRHLLVWSRGAREYLDRHSRFRRTWSSGRWADYEYLDADTRAVVVPAGLGDLKDVDLLGARVRLTDVRAGDVVVVRTNYYPVWTAADAQARAVPLFSDGGQLAFRAPHSGTFDVVLSYPRRRWLSALAVAGLIVGLVGLTFVGRSSA